MVITNEQIIEQLKEILDVKTYLQKDESGRFYGEIYADYRDEFDESTIRKIFMADSPRDMFYEIMDNICFDSDSSEHQEVLNIIQKHLQGGFQDKRQYRKYFREHGDFIRDWLHDNVYFKYPYDHYLKHDVCLDIILDCGDGNFDYTLNKLFGYNCLEKGCEEREFSSLSWLMKQQGYTDKQITEFIESEDFQGSKFLESVYHECINASSNMNALTFLVKMSLKEALDLNEFVNSIKFTDKGYEKNREEQDARQGYVVIDKKISCGLYNPWCGSGSVLEITPEKNVEVPLKFIDSALPDGCRGYSIKQIFGVCDSIWDDYSIEVKGAVAA